MKSARAPVNGWEVEYAHLRLDGDVQRGSRGLGADGGRAERARQVEERVLLRHGGGGNFCREGWRVVRRRGLVGVGVGLVVGSSILSAKSGQVRFARHGPPDIFSGGDLHMPALAAICVKFAKISRTP